MLHTNILQQSPPTEKHGASVSYVSYDSVNSLTSALQGVHTVLSCLKIVDPSQMQTSHLNLLHASIATGAVKRFSPCDFSLGPRTHKTVDLLANKSTLLKACQDLITEHASDIEVAQFQNGMFMQYLAQKLPDPYKPAASGDTRKEALLCNLEDPMMLDYIDIAAGEACRFDKCFRSPCQNHYDFHYGRWQVRCRSTGSSAWFVERFYGHGWCDSNSG